MMAVSILAKALCHKVGVKVSYLVILALKVNHWSCLTLLVDKEE